MKLSHLRLLGCAAAAFLFAPLLPVSAADYPIFADGASWKVLKEGGDGTFTLKDDAGKKIGVLEYNFPAGDSAKKAVIIAKTTVPIPEGTNAVALSARSSAPVKLTFRLLDSKGQKHQFRASLKGTGDWEAINIPLDKKMEHFGGPADGVKYFPLKEFVISVPQPTGAPAGKVEFSNAQLQ